MQTLDLQPLSLPAKKATVSLIPFVSVLIFIGIFTGFQGGRYILANRLQELGIASSLALFACGAWWAFFRMESREWKKWVYVPVLLLGGIMVLWSAVFTIQYSEPFVFSLFSSREFLLGFLGPGIFLVCRSGYPLESLERVIWLSLAALMANYLFFYSTMDLRATFFSGDHTVSNLVTYDEWRGFRLKPPTFAIMVALMGSVLIIGQRRSASVFLLGLLVFSVSAYIWSIVQFRSTLATMILSALLYPIFLRHPRRMKWLVIIAPLVIMALPFAVSTALQEFSSADGGSLRLKSYQTALASFMEKPVFGTGEDSSYGKNYQSLFGKTFYPSDLGMIGTLFKYGALGLCLYLFMHFHIWRRLLQANAQYVNVFGEHKPLLWSMLIFFTAQTFNLVLNPGLAYAQGITLGSLSLALASLWLHYLRDFAPKPQ